MVLNNKQHKTVTNMMSYLPDYSVGMEDPGRVQQFPELKR